jgi:hypothetical protein
MHQSEIPKTSEQDVLVLRVPQPFPDTTHYTHIRKNNWTFACLFGGKQRRKQHSLMCHETCKLCSG